jgi:hypothetical protein
MISLNDGSALAVHGGSGAGHKRSPWAVNGRRWDRGKRRRNVAQNSATIPGERKLRAGPPGERRSWAGRRRGAWATLLHQILCPNTLSGVPVPLCAGATSPRAFLRASHRPASSARHVSAPSARHIEEDMHRRGYQCQQSMISFRDNAHISLP